MAALPQSNTARFLLDYADANNSHTMEMRCADGVGAVDAEVAFNGVLTAVEDRLSLINIIGLRHIVKGSNISVPVAWGGPTTYGAGAQTPINAPCFFSAVGKDTAGRRARVYIYGIVGLNDASYRLEPGESGLPDALLTALTADPTVWLSISGLVPYWHRYINTGLNSYYQRKARD